MTDARFGWDNERSALTVRVPEFSIENHNVTNRQFMHFVENGGYRERSLWSTRIGHGASNMAWSILRSGKRGVMSGFIVECLRRGRCRWMFQCTSATRKRLRTQVARPQVAERSEFHRAAYGVPNSSEQRSYPWGEEAPNRKHGNFDFAHFEPAPAGSHPAGASAFGIHDLVGNGWEWTRTIFAPLPGFATMPFYPGYSANFFDGKHYVMKGGSPRTAACMLRRSFRNWFQPHYPYVYATFRCVED